jgi:hypothetical protein
LPEAQADDDSIPLPTEIKERIAHKEHIAARRKEAREKYRWQLTLNALILGAAVGWFCAANAGRGFQVILALLTAPCAAWVVLRRHNQLSAMFYFLGAYLAAMFIALILGRFSILSFSPFALVIYLTAGGFVGLWAKLEEPPSCPEDLL